MTVARNLLLLALATLISPILGATEIADAFPRDTLYYVEMQVTSEARTDLNEALEEINKVTKDGINQGFNKLPEMINKAVGTDLNGDQLKKVLGGIDALAFGATNIDLDGMQKGPQDALHWLVVMKHRNSGVMQEVLDAAIAKGSRFIVGRAAHGAAKLTNVEVAMGPPAGPNGANQQKYRFQIATMDGWVLMSGNESTLLDGIDHLNGEDLENTLPKNGNFKNAFDGERVDSRGFINVASLVRIFGRVKEANDVIDNLGLRSVRAIAFHGYTDYAAKVSESKAEVIFDEDTKPKWFNEIKAARTKNVLTNLVSKPALKFWAGADFSKAQLNSYLDMLKKAGANAMPGGKGEEEGEEEVPEAITALIDLEPKEMAFFIKKWPEVEDVKDFSDSMKDVEALAAFRFGRNFAPSIIDKLHEGDREKSENPEKFTSEVMTDAPAGFKGKVWEDGETTLYGIWKGKYLLVSPKNNFAEAVKGLEGGESNAVQNKMMEFEFSLGQILGLVQKAIEDIPEGEMVSGMIDLSAFKEMSIAYSAHIADHKLGFGARITGMPRAVDMVKMVSELVNGGKSKMSEEGMRAIRSLVFVDKINDDDGNYPATLEEVVANGYLKKSQLVDALDTRKDAKNSYHYFVPAKDAPRSQAIPLLAHKESWLADGKRLVLCLNGEFRVLDAKEWENAKALAKEGKPLPKLKNSGKKPSPLGEKD